MRHVMCIVTVWIGSMGLTSAAADDGVDEKPMSTTLFPCPEEQIAHYTAYRVDEPIQIDGHLNEASWGAAPRSPRFVDLISGQATIHDTRAAVMWDDEHLYVGFWVEEPHVTATLTERDAPIYTNNDVEVFIAGQDAYYEFEINALGTIYEVFFIWEEAYERGGYGMIPEFRKAKPGVRPFHGVGFKNHPRGPRVGFWNWDFPGLQSAVHVDGTLNQDDDRDRGWTVELAFPWKGMKWLAHADARSLPPRDGDVWRIDFSRFNQYKEAPPARDSGGWAWSAHGVWDSHVPECFPYIHFSTKPVLERPNEETKMDHNRIQICKGNPRYWQYKGKPILLLGGSVEDNLFQIPDLREHLDLLKSVGGNYVRCTMSCRDEGNVWPFQKVDGLYDLNQWNDEFWGRFGTFLELTAERDIIVQIEIWATFDYYRDNWAVNPFNPKNNRTYSAAETGLPEVVDSHPIKTGNNFFWSVPKENNQQTVLRYQQRFVDKILSHSLNYGHVLYCMDNETSVTPAWGEYWAMYIKAKAEEAGTAVETTEMWDAWDLSHPQHRATFDHPEIYSFCDISQNNHQKGQTHWDNAQSIRASLSPIRPLNNVKIYGADGGRFGTTRDGLERFWRNIMGGLASSRFHRPPSGQGLNEHAQAHIKSARMLTEGMDIFTCEPHNDLLSNRTDNGAYAIANPGTEYAIFFPNGEPVDLDLSGAPGRLRVRWLDIVDSRWAKEEMLEGGGTVALSPPGRGYWAVAISRPRDR